MNKRFYPKLAINNIKKNSRIYIPYLITCIITIAMYYIIHSLSVNEDMLQIRGGQQMLGMMEFGRYIVGIFSVVFLFYTNSFLMKRRKKEIGLWNILGMEKRHILRVMGFETLYIAIISLAGGLLLGILLEKSMYLFLVRLLDMEITLGFHIYAKALVVSGILFGIIFLLIFLNSIWQVSRSNPIELLHGGQVGEQEPKTKWVMAISGVCCLAAAYALSICLKSPLEAFTVFFLAVLLVIIGTYFLFLAGSIVFLKILRNNKKYYYKAQHFVSVSSMLYRMKRNAVGLANICILSTMVLVMLCSTTSLIIGEEDIIRGKYPNDFSITAYGQKEASPELLEVVNQGIQNHQMEVENAIYYSYYEIAAVRKDSAFYTDRDEFSNYRDVNYLVMIPLADYNRILGTDVALQENEILLYSPQKKYSYDTLTVFGSTYNIKERTEKMWKLKEDHVFTTYYLIVRDTQEIMKGIEVLYEDYGDVASFFHTYYGYDLIGSEENQNGAFVQIRDEFLAKNWDVVIYTHENARRDFLSLHGSLFFLGVFLSVLFTMAAVLVIYYKQISEGYEDKERYGIMQKVGMSHGEVKRSIHSQILTVFFLPLILAGIHVGFALPIIIRMMRLLGFFNTGLFVLCALGCFLAFALLYGIIYSITAKAYYKIVSWS